MSETKHTPGPWRVSPASLGEPTVYPVDTTKPLIAIVGRGYSRQKHYNAALIAAAPDMLEALENRAAVACRRTCDADAGLHTGECDQAMAALAKAKGER